MNRITVGASKIDAGVATKRYWVKLRIRLNSASESCKLISSIQPDVVVPEAEVKQFLKWADDFVIRLWNAPIYRLISLELSERSLNAEFTLTQFFVPIHIWPPNRGSGAGGDQL